MLRLPKNAGGAARGRLLKGLAARTVLGRGRRDGGNHRCRDERVERDPGDRCRDECIERVSRGDNRGGNRKCRAERDEAVVNVRLNKEKGEREMKYHVHRDCLVIVENEQPHRSENNYVLSNVLTHARRRIAS
jgi:hypothetical protein